MPFGVLGKIGIDKAAAHVGSYFENGAGGRPRFSGSKFETFAGGGDVNQPNRVTAEDLIAVSMLSVHVPAQAALGILGDLADELGDHLVNLPVDARFEELTDDEFETYLGDGGPAAGIWSLLRQPGARWGVGQTTASKILARKRPHLVPIYDSVVGKAVGLPNSLNQWTHWRKALLGAGGPEGVDLLRDIRLRSGQNHLSLLRVLDIAIWMEKRDDDTEPAPVVDTNVVR